MPTDSHSVAETPVQTEPSGFDLIRAEARDEVRRLFAQLGLSAETLRSIGCEPAALVEEDDD